MSLLDELTKEERIPVPEAKVTLPRETLSRLVIAGNAVLMQGGRCDRLEAGNACGECPKCRYQAALFEVGKEAHLW